MTEKEFKDDPTFVAWGPFIPSTYTNEAITLSDIVIATVVFFLTMINAVIAVHIGVKQTRSARSPSKSVYIWLIWLELLVSFIMAVECYLHLHKFIRPSFAFYFTILFWWCIQVQLLLQIIINRIRVINADRQRSLYIMVVTAVVVTLINISVFNIWIPARLQTSARYVHINEIWDRIEKGLYLAIDAALNWYFLRTVKNSLVENGLQKYNRLLKFNQRIIFLSLFMDVMIIAAMSIPNSFVYIQFHPLAYLVKLNIEMTMAHLIKKIALSTAKGNGRRSALHEYVSNDLARSGTRNNNDLAYGLKSFEHNTQRVTIGVRDPHCIDDDSDESIVKGEWDARRSRTFSSTSFPRGNQIKRTHEITVKSEPNPYYTPKELAVNLSHSELSPNTSRNAVPYAGTISAEKDSIPDSATTISTPVDNADCDHEDPALPANAGKRLSRCSSDEVRLV